MPGKKRGALGFHLPRPGERKRSTPGKVSLMPEGRKRARAEGYLADARPSFGGHAFHVEVRSATIASVGFARRRETNRGEGPVRGAQMKTNRGRELHWGRGGSALVAAGEDDVALVTAGEGVISLVTAASLLLSLGFLWASCLGLGCPRRGCEEPKTED